MKQYFSVPFLLVFFGGLLGSDIYEQRILILDFGCQYSQLIARRVREVGVYCELHPYTIAPEKIIAFAPSGIILSGGPETVTQEGTPRAPEIIFTLGCPILGICYGMQTMAVQLGGRVVVSEKGEFGYTKLVKTDNDCCQLLNCFDKELDVWMSHGDQVEVLPPGFCVAARSDNCPIAVMADEERKFYGLQFHPEVTHTTCGKKLIEQFVCDVCNCQKKWISNYIIQDITQQVCSKVGNQEVLLAVSGGVDSTVVAALLHHAIGDRLHCVFVDNGLLRLHEVEEVATRFSNLGIALTCIDARNDFLQALRGISDPEEKRKIIGHKFIEVFEKEAKKFPTIAWLAQGTIYPDVIESAQAASGITQVIKSHHNVGGLPERMRLGLIEPLRNLFKDEVRNIGLKLGLPSSVVFRHPFPGPGLAVRVLGEVKKEYIDILRRADAIYIEELCKYGLYDQVGQAFCVFLPVKSVGVKGDVRCYEYVIALRAVETVDFMTAYWVKFPPDFLASVANRILNEVPGVSRVVYDISNKPPATIEWE